MYSWKMVERSEEEAWNETLMGVNAATKRTRTRDSDRKAQHWVWRKIFMKEKSSCSCLTQLTHLRTMIRKIRSKCCNRYVSAGADHEKYLFHRETGPVHVRLCQSSQKSPPSSVDLWISLGFHIFVYHEVLRTGPIDWNVIFDNCQLFDQNFTENS